MGRSGPVAGLGFRRIGGCLQPVVAMTCLTGSELQHRRAAGLPKPWHSIVKQSAVVLEDLRLLVISPDTPLCARRPAEAWSAFETGYVSEAAFAEAGPAVLASPDLVRPRPPVTVFEYLCSACFSTRPMVRGCFSLLTSSLFGPLMRHYAPGSGF